VTIRWFLQAAIRLVLAAVAAVVISAVPAMAQTVSYDLKTTSVMRINLPVSQAVTVVISDAVGKIVSADPAIADAQPITDRSLYLVGKSFGTTTVSLFTETGAPVGLLAVEVGADVADIRRSIRAAVPSSEVTVDTVNGRIRVGGKVTDQQSMDKVLAIVAQYGSPAVINTMTLVGGQQVNLEVRILEAQRDAGRELGISWSGTVGGGEFNVGSTTDSFSSFVTQVISSGLGVNLNATINALESKALVRTLAEPNLTTLSGVKASFLAGGQVPVRTIDTGGNAALDYKDFGVRLMFTPVVMDDDRIQIHLTPEVSAISGFNDGSPVFNTRNLDATVELRDGQSFAVAGLLQSDTQLDQTQLPWLGDVPVLGSLFKSSSFKKHDTELVVIVTPRLVRPAIPGQVLATPLDQTVPANDFEFFALGKMEVTPKVLKSIQSGAGIVGPYGYIIDLESGS
jgi:pilus assembly protein CpaC